MYASTMFLLQQMLLPVLTKVSYIKTCYTKKNEMLGMIKHETCTKCNRCNGYIYGYFLRCFRNILTTPYFITNEYLNELSQIS